MTTKFFLFILILSMSIGISRAQNLKDSIIFNKETVLSFNDAVTKYKCDSFELFNGHFKIGGGSKSEVMAGKKYKFTGFIISGYTKIYGSNFIYDFTNSQFILPKDSKIVFPVKKFIRPTNPIF